LKISIIILNYNGKKFLEDCLKSVLSQSFQDFEIIFVDNDSSDDSLNFIKQKFTDERIKCHKSESNLGFAGGNNFGLKYAKGEYIVLLNNDTVVDNDWLINLYNVVSNDESIGIVQSLVHTEGIPEKYYLKNGTLNLLGHNIMEVFNIGKDGTGEIFQANGCSLIIRKKIIDSLGGLFLDEYFAYAEDSYLSFKVKFAGLKIIHTSNSVVKHFGSATIKEYKSSFRTYLQERNRVLNFLIFFSKRFRLKYYPIIIFNFKLKILMSLFLRKHSLKGIVKAYIWLFKNRKWVNEQRDKENRIKKINEEEVIKYLSGKLFNGENFFERIFNYFSLWYCKIVKIKVFELQ
jgi:GT2 family glycosyltransferase